MNQNDFDRLTLLSEKALLKKITAEELIEFKELMKVWYTSAEVDITRDRHSRIIETE